MTLGSLLDDQTNDGPQYLLSLVLRQYVKALVKVATIVYHWFALQPNHFLS